MFEDKIYINMLDWEGEANRKKEWSGWDDNERYRRRMRRRRSDVLELRFNDDRGGV